MSAQERIKWKKHVLQGCIHITGHCRVTLSSRGLGGKKNQKQPKHINIKKSEISLNPWKCLLHFITYLTCMSLIWYVL